MTSRIFILFLGVLLISGCGSHTGTRKPNWFVADFDKYGEAYYLDLKQVKIGDNKATVEREYGKKYDVVMNNGRETWKYASYRTTPFTDPLHKYVYVGFHDDLVIDVSEEYLNQAHAPKTSDPTETLRKLKKMYDEGILTEQEYLEKKHEILNRM